GLKVWDLATGVLEQQLKLDGNGTIVLYEPGGSTVLTEGLAAQRTDLRSMLQRIDLRTMQPTTTLGRTIGVLLTGASPSDEEALILTPGCSVVAVNVRTGSIRKHFDWDNPQGRCPAEVVSADGRRFARSILKSEIDVGGLLLGDISNGGQVSSPET